MKREEDEEKTTSTFFLLAASVCVVLFNSFSSSLHCFLSNMTLTRLKMFTLTQIGIFSHRFFFFRHFQYCTFLFGIKTNLLCFYLFMFLFSFLLKLLDSLTLLIFCFLSNFLFCMRRKFSLFSASRLWKFVGCCCCVQIFTVECTENGTRHCFLFVSLGSEPFLREPF